MARQHRKKGNRFPLTPEDLSFVTAPPRRIGSIAQAIGELARRSE